MAWDEARAAFAVRAAHAPADAPPLWAYTVRLADGRIDLGAGRAIGALVGVDDAAGWSDLTFRAQIQVSARRRHDAGGAGRGLEARHVMLLAQYPVAGAGVPTAIAFDPIEPPAAAQSSSAPSPPGATRAEASRRKADKKPDYGEATGSNLPLDL